MTDTDAAFVKEIAAKSEDFSLVCGCHPAGRSQSP
jgi:hypothetical protein